MAIGDVGNGSVDGSVSVVLWRRTAMDDSDLRDTNPRIRHHDTGPSSNLDLRWHWKTDCIGSDRIRLASMTVFSWKNAKEMLEMLLPMYCCVGEHEYG